MFHDQGITTLPRNFKERPVDDKRPRTPSGYDKREVNDLKFSLDRVLYEKEKSFEGPRRQRRSRYDPRRNTTGVIEYELRQDRINSPAAHTVKDQEWLIQDLKKENFDLKLRLFMEQKEREKLLNGNSREAADLESDLTEALDELEHAMDKENQLTHELSTARRHDKTLTTKLKRLERVCQHQEEDIIRLSLELENLKMEIAAKDSGIASPNGLRTRLQSRGTSYPNGGGRLSPTSDFTDRFSDRLSAGYPDRSWDHYSDRGSDSGSYVTTPHERKTFFDERYPDDMSTSDESEARHRVVARVVANTSDTERLKRREKLLSRRVKNYQDVQENDGVDNSGHNIGSDDQGQATRDRIGDANNSPNLDPPRNGGEGMIGHNERAVDVAPDLLNTTPERASPASKTKGFPLPRWFAKKNKGNNKSTSKSMDELNSIGRIDIKNIHKKNKKYNFWGCVRARESMNENIRSEYAPVRRPQLNSDKATEKARENAVKTMNAANKTETAAVDFI